MDLFTFAVTEQEITEAESTRLSELEGVIERGLKTFVDVGTALLEIRDSRLYRKDFDTFEDYCLDRWGLKQSRAYQLMDAAEVVTSLKSSTIVELPANEAQARPLTSLPPEQQPQAWKIAVETAPEGKVTAAHVQSVVDNFKGESEKVLPSTPHVAYNSGNNEWYTPAEYIEAARKVMGAIDLDPASSDIANQTVKATVYFTAEDDGLRFSWDGRVWMNPPYASDLIGRFCEKLTYHFTAGDVPEATVLVNNATETTWFQSLLSCASAVCFIRRRVKFIDTEGNPSGAPLQGQALLYLGQNPDKFANVFAGFGTVLYGQRKGQD